MSTRRAQVSAAALALVAAVTAAACGPVRFDDRPQIRGVLVAVDASAIGILHKTGRTYRVEVTRDTTISDNRRAGRGELCPGLRATVFLRAPDRYTASEVQVWSGRCR